MIKLKVSEELFKGRNWESSLSPDGKDALRFHLV